LLPHSDLGYKKLASEARGQFAEQKRELSCSFRCDQSPTCYRYAFGHTLLCLDVKQYHLSLMYKRRSLAAPLGVIKFIGMIGTNLV
jgi:hypothetical protein